MTTSAVIVGSNVHSVNARVTVRAGGPWYAASVSAGARARESTGRPPDASTVPIAATLPPPRPPGTVSLHRQACSTEQAAQHVWLLVTGGATRRRAVRGRRRGSGRAWRSPGRRWGRSWGAFWLGG